jgi:hypothetical protein
VSDFRQLLVVAISLTASESPSEAELRRSVSTLYYAVFHRLMKLTADALAPNVPNEMPWIRAYRSLEHKRSKNQLVLIAERIPAFRQLSLLFGKLQSDREKADYEPAPFSLSKSDVRLRIREVILALQQLDVLTPNQCLEAAVELAFPKRSEENTRIRQ